MRMYICKTHYQQQLKFDYLIVGEFSAVSHTVYDFICQGSASDWAYSYTGYRSLVKGMLLNKKEIDYRIVVITTTL